MTKRRDTRSGAVVLSFTEHTTVPAGAVLEAAHDFTRMRSEIFPAVVPEHFVVHSLEEASADVTEGTAAGIGVNWERCRYEWSSPDSVTATVIDSNVYGFPGSLWEIRATPSADGSTVEMIWTRIFAKSMRGRIFGILYSTVGNLMFQRYSRRILGNIEDRVAVSPQQ